MRSPIEGESADNTVAHLNVGRDNLVIFATVHILQWQMGSAHKYDQQAADGWGNGEGRSGSLLGSVSAGKATNQGFLNYMLGLGL